MVDRAPGFDAAARPQTPEPTARFQVFEDPKADQTTLWKIASQSEEGRYQFTPSELGTLISDGANTRNFAAASRELGAGVQRAYNSGGLTGAQDFVRQTDAATPSPGIGPMLTNDNGRLKVHIAEAAQAGISPEQLRSGAYFQQGNKWYRDLVKPIDIDKTSAENAARARDAGPAADALMSNPNFVRSGKMDDQTASQLELGLFRHDGDMPQFTGAVNDALRARGSNYELSVDVKLNQSGMHGNTVTQYRVQTFDRNTHQRIQGYTGLGHDTVRAIAPAPGRQWD